MVGEVQQTPQEVLHDDKLSILTARSLQIDAMLKRHLKASTPHSLIRERSHTMLLGQDLVTGDLLRRPVVEDLKVRVHDAGVQSCRVCGLVAKPVCPLFSIRHLHRRRRPHSRLLRADSLGQVLPKRLRATEICHATVASAP